MKIFVSHSIRDSKLIKDLKSNLEPHDLKLLIAEHHPDITYSTISDKIEQMIDICDVAIILLTKNGFNSNFVQQEIGYIKRAGKNFIQVVENGIEKKITGFNYGKGYIEYNESDLQKTIDKIRAELTYFLDEKQKRIQRKLIIQQNLARLQKIEKEEKSKRLAFSLVAGAVVFSMFNN
jgi:hypothetical protein